MKSLTVPQIEKIRRINNDPQGFVEGLMSTPEEIAADEVNTYLYDGLSDDQLKLYRNGSSSFALGRLAGWHLSRKNADVKTRREGNE